MLQVFSRPSEIEEPVSRKWQPATSVIFLSMPCQFSDIESHSHIGILLGSCCLKNDRRWSSLFLFPKVLAKGHLGSLSVGTQASASPRAVIADGRNPAPQKPHDLAMVSFRSAEDFAHPQLPQLSCSVAPVFLLFLWLPH